MFLLQLHSQISSTCDVERKKGGRGDGGVGVGEINVLGDTLLLRTRHVYAQRHIAFKVAVDVHFTLQWDVHILQYKSTNNGYFSPQPTSLCFDV